MKFRKPGDRTNSGTVEKYTGTSYDILEKIHANLDFLVDNVSLQEMTIDQLFYRYVGTAGQTVFTGDDTTGRLMAVPGSIPIIYINRVRQESDTYSVAGDGSSVTLSTGVEVGDLVQVSSFAFNSDGSIYHTGVMSNATIIQYADDTKSLYDATVILESTATTKASEASASYASFDRRYLGTKDSDPTVDNEGNALLKGALYFSESSEDMRMYTGAEWEAAYASLSGAVLGSNNGSDFGDVSVVRDTLGLKIGTDVQAFATVLSNTTASFLTAEKTKLTGIEDEATADQTAGEIETIVSHDNLVGFEAEEHIKWGSTNAANIHADNYTDTTYSVGDGGLTEINLTTAKDDKLTGIEDDADVTGTVNVTAAGALMDSEVTNLADLKVFAPADYATAAQGSTADSALQPASTDTLTNKTLASPAITGAVSGTALATQLEAEAGTNNDQIMTPLRSAQAIAALTGGVFSFSVFTSSGTWTRPSDVKKVLLYVTGSGGGPAQDNGNPGYPGWTVIKELDVTGISSASISIGAAGPIGPNTTWTASGNPSTFSGGGSTVVAAGGPGTDGSPGSNSNYDLAIYAMTPNSYGGVQTAGLVYILEFK
jgi:hypothetical protein